MEVFGWIMLVVFGLVGFAVIAYALGGFLLVQLRVFTAKIGKEIEIIHDDTKEKGELKKARLSKKRKAQDKIATRKVDAQIATMNEKADAKYGEGK